MWIIVDAFSCLIRYHVFLHTAEFRENVSAKLRMKIMSIDIFSYGPHFTSGLSKLTIFYKLNLPPPVSCLLCLFSCCPLTPSLRPMRARPVPGLNQSESWIADPLTQGVWRGFSRWIAPSLSGHRIRDHRSYHISHFQSLWQIPGSQHQTFSKKTINNLLTSQ